MPVVYALRLRGDESRDKSLLCVYVIHVPISDSSRSGGLGAPSSSGFSGAPPSGAGGGGGPGGGPGGGGANPFAITWSRGIETRAVPGTDDSGADAARAFARATFWAKAAAAAAAPIGTVGTDEREPALSMLPRPLG